MYFKNFPVTVIDFAQYGEAPQLRLVSDIITNVRAKASLLSNLVYYDVYDIRDGQTPEIISELFYGTPVYHWIIMLVNEKYDYINDFPLSQLALEEYVAAKYENSDDIHHYESPEGYVVNSDWLNAIPVTNYEYEEQVNESKRTIKIVPAALLGDVLRQFREIMK